MKEKYIFVFSLATLYFIYSIIHAIWIYKKPQSSFYRQLAVIISDIAAVSIGMIAAGEVGSFFYFLYLWIILGNGLRFGEKHLYIATITGILGFCTVFYFSDYWRSQPFLSSGFLFSLFVLPLFYFILVRRLHKQNNKLIEDLKKTEFFALHDSLTMLPNRAFLLTKIDKMINNNKTFAFLFIDLDNFKQANDKYGHDFGDQILKEVGKRLKIFEKQGFFLARLGGDEFAIIINSCNKSFLEKVATEIIKELEKPYNLTHKISFLSASIGIYCKKNNEKIKISDTLKNADEAMYIAKINKLGFAFYDKQNSLALQTA
ncbi:GGDEF domain-containing protein [Nitrosophilus alvini]|uniref:GGDEF domain-containing protein n=1 Tax=Nitrosophilus alvini TaxID=2714855 RepID=UPI00190BC8B8|nr:GGDEF domain-containing protein [Nitrosophilus alvini]